MARTCPACGSKAIDEQSQFCNKCGTPFPADQPKKVLVRTTPRLADSPPPPPPPPLQQQPVASPPAPEYYAPPAPEYQAPAAPPARAYAEPPRVRVPLKPLVRRQTLKEKPLPFKKLIARDYPKLVYWLGVIAIILIVFAGITGDSSNSGKSTDTASGTDAENKSSDFLAGIPLFWIGVFLFGNLLWRVVCETGAAAFSLHGSMGSTGFEPAIEPEDPFGADDSGSGNRGSDEMVPCPRCGKIVPADELETCEVCGIRGCSSCVRKMGLLKAKWTCRDCYQKK